MLPEWEEAKRLALECASRLEPAWRDLPKIEMWWEEAEWSGEWRGLGEFAVRFSLGRGDFWFRRGRARRHTRAHFRRPGVFCQLVVLYGNQDPAYILGEKSLARWKLPYGDPSCSRELSPERSKAVMDNSLLRTFEIECRTRLSRPVQSVNSPAGR